MDFSELRRFQQGLLEKGVPGCEIIVMQDHRVLYHECMGRNASPDNHYFLYSCTKPMTAVAAMMCMEQGLFRLDDEAAKYIPAFGDIRVQTKEGLAAASTPVTIRHLMTMTAGLNYDLNCPPLQALRRETGGDASTVQVAEALAHQPLCFQPGDRWQYSLCLDVLGAVIEEASGRTLANWFDEHFFQPLGMKDSYFFVPGCTDEKLAPMFSFHQDSRQLIPLPPVNDMIPFSRFYSGGAGLVSTAADYAAFADALACGSSAQGYRMLTGASLNRMRTSQLAMGEVQSSFSCTCGEEYAYGLGVRTRVRKAENALGSLGELGWDGAAGADLMVDPDRHLSMVLMQHVRGWPGLLGSFHLPLRDCVYAALEPNDTV